MSNIIGFSGLIGSGKSHAATYLKETHGYRILSFAGPVKEAAAVVFGVNVNLFSDEEEKAKVDPFWGITRRTMMQKLATEGVRNVFREDFWIQRAKKTLSTLKTDKVVFDDVRFDNEADWIRSEGGVIVGIRRSSVKGTAHASEQGLSEYHRFIDNNGSLFDLYKEIDKVMEDVLDVKFYW